MKNKMSQSQLEAARPGQPLGGARSTGAGTMRARPKRTHSFVWSLGCPHGGAMDGWDRTKMTNDLDCSGYIETEC